MEIRKRLLSAYKRVLKYFKRDLNDVRAGRAMDEVYDADDLVYRIKEVENEMKVFEDNPVSRVYAEAY